MLNSRCNIFVFLFLYPAFLFAQQWEPLGPDSFPRLIRPADYSLKIAQGIGRVTCLRFQNSKKCSFGKREVKIFVGSPYGGLWCSSDSGSHWQSSGTDQLPNIGIADLVFHPKKPSVCYLATGDPDCIIDPNVPALGCESCQSRGVVKSMDGGKSWSTPIGEWVDFSGKLDTGFWSFPSRKILRRLFIHPKHPEVLLAVIHSYSYKTRSYDGYIYRSADAGEHWSPVYCGTDALFKDLEVQPSSPDIIYVGGRSLVCSRDGGQTWNSLSGHGLPADSLVQRCEIGICKTRPKAIYVLCVLKDNRSNEIYYSANEGAFFEKIASVVPSPPWRTALVVDPSNPDLLYYSAGNRICSLTRTPKGWVTGNAGAGVHDDIHDLTFSPDGNTLYASSDGGLYASEDHGRTWKNQSAGLNIAECWSVSVAQSGPLTVLSGFQDCGTQQLRVHGDSLDGWNIVRGGDGMECAIDRKKPAFQYATDGNNNLIARSEDGGITWSRNLAPTRTQSGQYLRPFLLQPKNTSTVYTAYQDVFRSVNQGESWQSVSVFKTTTEGQSVIALAIAPSDTMIIYAAFPNATWSETVSGRLFKSADGGKTWKDVSKGLRGSSYSQISSVAVDPFDAGHVLVGFRGGWEIKVMESRTGGTGERPWINYSTGLPSDADVNAILFAADVKRSVFIGTHIGVFSRSEGMQDWKILGKGLPRVLAVDLDLKKETGELYVATHGRGIWRLTLRP